MKYISSKNQAVPFDFDDDKIFNILSHPLRRRILKECYYQGKITFTLMSNQWGTSTGGIYHHLKLLGNLLVKDKDNAYRLSAEGKTLCIWFLDTVQGQLKIEKISVLTEYTYPIFAFIEKAPQANFVLYLLNIIFLFLLRDLRTIILGPFLIQKSNEFSANEIFLVNLIIYIGINTIIFGFFKLTSGVTRIFVVKLGLTYSPNLVMLYMLYLLSNFFPVLLEVETVYLFQIIFQILFLLILTILILYNTNYKFEIASLHAISILYLLLSVSLIL